MDLWTFILTLAAAESIPGSATADAVAARDRAEAAARSAEAHNFGVTDDGNGLILTKQS